MEERPHFDAAGAVLVDELGVLAAEMHPTGELAVVLDIGGRVTNRTERERNRYLMRAGQAAELIAEIVVAAQRLEPHFRHELDRAIKREQERIAAVDSEHNL